MKPSIIKLIGLYSLLYALFSVAVVLWACMTALHTGFSLPAVGRLLMLWEPKWWGVGVLGALLHVLGYLRALKRPRLMLGNLLCLWAFIGYVLVPNYSAVLIVLQLVAVAIIMSYRRPDAAALPE
ncbi:hypothetical protein ACFQ3L_10620 [Lacticaseibacillus jixianensis]|uniref:Integral membrane protein n=1 Tax=Lacticaseibacillus jixianensis TaxID=2486012 RepID=A0ABW4BAI6_9LACO|nr:hypothetical protein [Lacticaseibacillus jixianensis]